MTFFLMHLVTLPVVFYLGFYCARVSGLAPSKITDDEYKRLRRASQWRGKSDKGGQARKVFHELYSPLEQ